MLLQMVGNPPPSSICDRTFPFMGDPDNFVVENYVWYFVDKMYSARWGWTGTGDFYPQARGTELPSEPADGILPPLTTALELGLESEQTDASELPVPRRPASCHGELEINTTDTSGLTCEYSKPPNPDDLPAP